MSKGKKPALSIDNLSKVVYPLCTVFMTLIFGVLTFNLGALNYKLSQRQYTQNSLVQPILYTIEPVESAHVYQVQTKEQEIEIPATMHRIQVHSGAIATITALGYDGESVYTTLSLPVLPDWNDGHYIDVELQSSPTPLIVDDIYYDYFFLYIESMAGEPSLELICTVVDLQNQKTLSTWQYRKTDLLKLGLSAALPPHEYILLQHYQDLYRHIARLNNNLSENA